MNTISVTVFVVIVVLVQEQLCGIGDDIGDFFKAIPGTITDAFESAWKSIKKPFTIRRLGHGGRRKKRMRKTSTTSTSTTTTEYFPPDPTPGNLLFRRVALPLLPTPEWRGMDNWNLLQRPRYALTRGVDYEHRRHQISKWADRYLGPRPTRVVPTTATPEGPTNTLLQIEGIPTRWVRIEPKRTTVKAKEKDSFVPIYYWV